MSTVADIRGLAVAGTLAQKAEPNKGKVNPAGPERAMEPKYDGWRIIAYIGDGHVDLFTRSGNAPPGELPKIAAELAERFPPGTVLDGEAVALTVLDDGTVLNEWGVAQSVMTTLGGHAAAEKITYMVFDLIAHRGLDARGLGYADRRVLLERIFEASEFEAIALSTTMEATHENYEALVKMGMEGAITKRLDAPYASGKKEGAGWEKFKKRHTVEVVVTGFKPGKNGLTGMVGSFTFGQYDPDTGELVERGASSGFDMRTRRDMTKNPEKWLGRVIEITHQGVDIGQSKSGRFRSPDFTRVRPDKAPEQVVIHDA